MQGLIVAITLLAAVAYIGRRIYTALARAHDPCHGCQGCALRDMTRKAHTKEKGKQAHCDRNMTRRTTAKEGFTTKEAK